VLASAAAIAEHAGSNATHGCSSIASSTAVAGVAADVAQLAAAGSTTTTLAQLCQTNIASAAGNITANTAAVASLALGIWTETNYPATLTHNTVTYVSSIASLPTTIPYAIAINSRNVTWMGPATTTVTYVQRCRRIATDTWSDEIATTSWDAGLTPDLTVGTSSVCVTVGVLR
jgi:hypothetical protein